VLILIDHQPWVAFAVNSIDPSLLSNNLEGLASSAKALDVPVILTTVGAEGGKLRDPLMRAVADVFPDKTPIDRTATNAWADIREAGRSNRPQDIADGRAMDRGVSSPDRDLALADGYRVFFVSDCSGGLTVESHEDAKAAPRTGRRDADQLGRCRVRVGARLHVRRAHKVNPAVMKNGAGVGLALEQAFAQS
jgi:nicotinamidase-related amidase